MSLLRLSFRLLGNNVYTFLILLACYILSPLNFDDDANNSIKQKPFDNVNKC